MDLSRSRYSTEQDELGVVILNARIRGHGNKNSGVGEMPDSKIAALKLICPYQAHLLEGILPLGNGGRLQMKIAVVKHI